MPIYDGVVSIGETDIPVIIDLDTERIRMSASGTEIGEWTVDEFEIARIGSDRYGITAENETLEFVPNEPTRFDEAVNGSTTHEPVHEMPAKPDPMTERHPIAGVIGPEPEIPNPVFADPVTAAPVTADPVAAGPITAEVPPPSPVTMVMFYVLCAITALLGLWALWAIIFG